MSSIEISFENPWYLLLILPVLAIVIFPFFMLPKKRRYTVKRIVPVVLHALLSTALIFVLAGFSVINHTNEQAVMLLLDLSQSTQTVQDAMQSHANELLSKIDETTPVGVVAFGKGQVYSVRLDDHDRTLSLQSPGADATDLEQALEYTASLAPKDKALRIVLFTDGKQTDGNAENMAYNLANQGVRLDAVYYDTTNLPTKEVQIGSFSAPEGIYVGNEAVLTAEIKSNTACKAVLKLYENEILLTTKDVDVTSAGNVIEFTVQPQSTGVHTYHLVLEVSEDTIAQNNEAYVCLPVAGEATVLIIADTEENAQALEQVLKAENAVTSVSAYQAPKTLVELCKYDAVVLSNVEYYDLPRGYDKILDAYVGSYGRTLLAVGGRDTFMYGDMEGTALVDMLPVSLTLEESTEGKSVALMLVLDCSSSMDGDRFVIAKQGAIRCLDAMTDNDYVGIVSFSKTANLDSSLLRADTDNKESLTRVISGLELGRGTYYTEALTLAGDELAKSDADIKHILFLSDGQPSDSGYYAVVSNAYEQGITVSTIGLGYSSYILSGIAQYGNGRYYYVKSADELPNIMLSETEQAKVSSLIVGDIVPIIKEQSALTESIGSTQLAPLGGYLGTTLKENATAYITTDRGHPIYAAWEYGFGKVACFTSDLNGSWSDRWLSDSVGKAVTLGMIKTTIASAHHESSLIPQITLYGKTAKIAVLTASGSETNAVAVTVSKDGKEQTYKMNMVYPGRYEASVPLEGNGAYALHITEKGEFNILVDELYTSMAVSYSLEYDAFMQGSKQFLYNLCEYSDGTVFDDMDKLAKVKMPSIQTVYDPIVPLSILLAVLILSDIAVRKIRWKDLKAYYMKFKQTFQKG